jgi:hypothetical protein
VRTLWRAVLRRGSSPISFTENGTDPGCCGELWEGVLRHDTKMEVEKQYVDTHRQSEVGFAFCYLLGFALLPRLKNLNGNGSTALTRESREHTPTFSRS